MAEIDDLVEQVTDEALRDKLKEAVKNINKQKNFGLVFQEHLPECTPLYDIPIRKGCLAVRKSGSSVKVSEAYFVLRIKGNTAVCIPKAGGEAVEIPKAELVSLAEFGEPIYPYLKPIASVCNAPDSSLWHTLIEAENYHALQLLEYLYAGKVDCIYIDPPYNTGAKDWKYNNDYVDSADQYRHSKWLSMMKKRLELADRLLNKNNSVLIVTIDEKEYLHLGCLLEEIFKEANIQMVSDVTHPSGVARTNQFSRVEEYLFFVSYGDAKPIPTETTMLDFEMTGEYKNQTGSGIVWRRMIRAGSGSLRQHSENCFYPIFVNEKEEKIESIGFPPGKGIDRNTVEIPKGCIAVWPIHQNGEEGRWQISRPKLVEALKAGTAKLGNRNRFGQWAMNYLSEGMVKEIENGEIEIVGKDKNGALVLKRASDKLFPAKSVWNQKNHDATQYGSYLIGGIFGKRFSYPKSLYSTRDAIRFYIANNPNALVVDFFAGSGTTLHAVNLLNAEDGGKRRCILVTNNEVSADEANSLSEKGYQPGDEEWEKLGIARYVTWPRTVCSIEGHDINGEPLKGNYLGSDIPMSDGFKANVAYFKLGFLDKTSVALGRQFRELLPILWLKAGAYGKCPELDNNKEPKMLILPENRFAVLCDEAHFPDFRENMTDEIETIFFVTDYEQGYITMASNFSGKHTYQLYRDYLDNFRINTKRD